MVATFINKWTGTRSVYGPTPFLPSLGFSSCDFADDMEVTMRSQSEALLKAIYDEYTIPVRVTKRDIENAWPTVEEGFAIFRGSDECEKPGSSLPIADAKLMAGAAWSSVMNLKGHLPDSDVFTFFMAIMKDTDVHHYINEYYGLTETNGAVRNPSKRH
jgi:hypothetical protein